MSTDGRYILNYEYQPYSAPTPMELDKQIIRNEVSDEIEFIEFDHGHTIHFQMPKYTLLRDIIEKLKAERIFEAINGGLYKIIKK